MLLFSADIFLSIKRPVNALTTIQNFAFFLVSSEGVDGGGSCAASFRTTLPHLQYQTYHGITRHDDVIIQSHTLSRLDVVGELRRGTELLSNVVERIE